METIVESGADGRRGVRRAPLLAEHQRSAACAGGCASIKPHGGSIGLKPCELQWQKPHARASCFDNLPDDGRLKRVEVVEQDDELEVFPFAGFVRRRGAPMKHHVEWFRHDVSKVQFERQFKRLVAPCGIDSRLAVVHYQTRKHRRSARNVGPPIRFDDPGEPSCELKPERVGVRRWQRWF
jgi:hypothetical protein